MDIKELKLKQGNVDIAGTVIDKQEPREWKKFDKAGKVCNAILKDDSGAVALTLWNDDVDKVKLGSKIKLINGYCGEYNGDKQVSAGKIGKIEVIGQDDSIIPIPKDKPKETFDESEIDTIEDEDEEDKYDNGPTWEE